jgi:hypothetical protein
MFYKLKESVCNTIHHLLEYTGSAFRDLVPIVNPWPTDEIDNSATLFKSVNKWNKVLIWEKIFIYKHALHIMNFEVLPESSLITKYVYRAPKRHQ